MAIRGRPATARHDYSDARDHCTEHFRLSLSVLSVDYLASTASSNVTKIPNAAVTHPPTTISSSALWRRLPLSSRSLSNTHSRLFPLRHDGAGALLEHRTRVVLACSWQVKCSQQRVWDLLTADLGSASSSRCLVLSTISSFLAVARWKLAEPLLPCLALLHRRWSSSSLAFISLRAHSYCR